ncbi:hypothetical protein PHYPSEUDO_014667 [Phytophthora pseudosyringae]|uniref:Uncharacterized protein n=1 Tax=Phytophthora pseudosyringae TaxID=221518 RepID=A0A8T1W0M8_9STRA|nr:hypothetical protein PHYPSEUDO_014667 [Phytophthora pseudosyringae]
MKPSTLILLLVLAVTATIAQCVYGLEIDTQAGTHLRHLQGQPDDQQPEQPEQPEQPDQPDQPEQPEQPGMPMGGGDTNTANTYSNNPGSNEIVMCYPGSWNWPRCRYGGGGLCFPGSWNWPRCRFGGGGGCYRGSWNWPRCRYGGF